MLGYARMNLGHAYLVDPTGDGGQAYFGIVSDEAITSVNIVMVNAFDSAYSLDDVAYGFGRVSVDEASWGSIKARYQQE